eukprot:COSAG02_NODE_32942_length_508_cov_0.682152_1_plen_113_part_10
MGNQLLKFVSGNTVKPTAHQVLALSRTRTWDILTYASPLTTRFPVCVLDHAQFSSMAIEDNGVGGSVCVTAQGYEHVGNEAGAAATPVTTHKLRRCTPYVKRGAGGAGKCEQD